MSNNYKPIGNYIQPVKVRNDDLRAKDLLGINIDKYFMPSVANVVGTDLTNYKVVLKNQFACNLMHVGRDKRIPIAMSEKDEAFMVSPAYEVFEIKDTKELLPEYVMMWFRRAEYDRYAWFQTDADVRGGLPWKSFIEMQIPVPPISRQRELVTQYNTIQRRINQNNALIEKLEQTAHAVYKEWFVDKVDEKWEEVELNNLVQTQYGYTASATTEEVGPKFLRITDIARNHITWSEVPYCPISEKDFEKYELHYGDIVVARTGATSGYAKRLHKNFPKSVFASFLVRLIPNDINLNLFLGIVVDSQNYRDFVLTNAEGSAQPQANATLLTSFKLIIPETSIILNFNKIIEPIFDLIEAKQSESQKLEQLKTLLLSRMASIEKSSVFAVDNNHAFTGINTNK